jgi:bacteriocin-like protein
MSKLEAVASNPGTTKEHNRELTADELNAVTGGRATPKLLEAAVKGKVFKSVEIHGTA